MKQSLFGDGKATYSEFLKALTDAGIEIPNYLSIKAARAEVNMTGEPLFKSLRDQYMKIDLPTLRYEPACFAGGTLVHTKEGLKPIETIQVGDWVLSKHESGEGEREYKRVTQTFKHEDREVINLGIGGLQTDGSVRHYDLAVTPEHPIWVQGKGWKEAGKIKATYPDTKLEFLNTDNPAVGFNLRLFKTDHPDIAWHPLMSKADWLGSMGKRVHVPSMQVVETDVFIGIDYVRTAKRTKPEHFYTTTVYNLEVEDFHTYYVGEPGIWVHNKNIQLSAKAASGYIPTANELANPFLSRSELNGYLRNLVEQVANGAEQAKHLVSIVKSTR